MGVVQVGLVTSAAKAAYEMAFPCLRPTGTLFVVGLPAERLCFPPILRASSEAHIRASAVGTREDLLEVLALAAAVRIPCRTGTRPLAEANQPLDQHRTRRVSARLVI